MIIAIAWSRVHVAGTDKLEEIQDSIPKMIHYNGDLHSGNGKFSSFLFLLMLATGNMYLLYSFEAWDSD